MVQSKLSLSFRKDEPAEMKIFERLSALPRGHAKAYLLQLVRDSGHIQSPDFPAAVHAYLAGEEPVRLPDVEAMLPKAVESVKVSSESEGPKQSAKNPSKPLKAVSKMRSFEDRGF